MAIVIECAVCKKTIPVVLGTKTKEEKPLARCPACKSDQIKVLSSTPQESFV